jgi:hypothetical protein
MKGDSKEKGLIPLMIQEMFIKIKERKETHNI